MISVGDFTVLAEATGESVQDMTPLLFFFFILWIMISVEEKHVLKQPWNRLNVLLCQNFFKWSSNDCCLPDKFYVFDL